MNFAKHLHKIGLRQLIKRTVLKFYQIMKTIRAKYLQGKLINEETGEQVQLTHGMSYTITGRDRDFTERPLPETLRPLKGQDKIDQLRSDKYKNRPLFLVAEAGAELFYKLNHPSKYKTKSNTDLYYNAILEEDLYMYLTDTGVWHLCSCICKTTRHIENIDRIKANNPLVIHAPVIGNSLSHLYSEMVVTFYPHLKAPGINAITTFHIKKEDNIFGCETIKDIRKELERYQKYILSDMKLPKGTKLDKEKLTKAKININIA